MKQRQINSGQDIKTELKIRSGKSSKPGETSNKNTTSSNEPKHPVDEMMQGKNLRKKDREGMRQTQTKQKDKVAVDSR